MSDQKVLYTTHLITDLCNEILNDPDTSDTLIGKAAFLLSIVSRDYGSMEGYEPHYEGGSVVGVKERARP
jgi:hypothetical protein